MNLSRWLAAIIIIVVTISGLGFTKFQQIQAAIAFGESFPEPSAAVNSVVTSSNQYQEYEKASGQVSATEVVQLQNELPGLVTKVNFTAGQFVKKGQVLLTLNTVEENAQLNASKANLELAENNFTRIEKLLNQNKVSQQEFDNAKTQLQVSKANVDNLNAVIAKKTVIAPFSGTVGLDTFQVGQFISANTNITTLVGSEPQVWIDFQLAQTKARLSIGDEILVKAINASKNDYKTAKIIAKNSQINNQSRHLKYRAELLNGRQWYEHNELVDISILKPAQDLVIVPNSAVSRNQHGSYVFTLEKDEAQQYRAHRVEVELGKRIKDSQIIMSGIEAGKLIATEGSFKLREGLLVFPTPAKANTFFANIISGE